LPEGSAFTGGARLIGVTAVGTFCWGAVTGLALVKVGLSAAQALGMVALVYSGTAQLAALLANLRLWACSRSSRWSARCWSRGSP
jgi:predicted branched-subunit amino acid permease